MKTGKKSEAEKGATMGHVLLQTLAVGFAYILLVLMPLVLLLNYASEHSGPIVTVLICLYILTLAVVGALLYRRKERREERAVMGDQAFFERYPREWKKELRRWRRAATLRLSEPQQSQQIPAALRMYREAGPQEQARFGFAPQGETGLSIPYDELYYRDHPRQLDRELRRQRRIRQRSGQVGPSAVEDRLESLKRRLEAER